MKENENLEEIVLKEETENLEEIKPIEVEMVEKQKYLLLYSDFENYKRRTQKEKEEYSSVANKKILLDILPTLDNFERAGALEDGIQLIYDNLKKTLTKSGLKEVEAKGLVFDPDMMEAITQIAADVDMVGKIVDVVEKGYMLNGKIIRFAKVVVGA